MVKVLIQLVNIKTCNLPGYNLLLLRELLSKYYRYPNEPWNSDQFFKELFTDYLKNPARPGDFGLLVFCKNNTCKWVCDKIEKLVKPTLASISVQTKTDTEHINSMRSWLKSIIEDEGVAEVVKRA
ncbi:hypothetical protein HHI36_020840 [Cryptolaemus montrouzieri]|uniref:Uncharacterized protein n=1 Tax=Cryptolaemus montrouzieri TaxID=559131 RepID=A0ABD2NBG0_9CUCU